MASILTVANVHFDKTGATRLDHVSNDGVVRFSGNALKVAGGSSGNRPSNEQGLIRYNTDLGKFEYFDGTGTWQPFLQAYNIPLAFDKANNANVLAFQVGGALDGLNVAAQGINTAISSTFNKANVVNTTIYVDTISAMRFPVFTNTTSQIQLSQANVNTNLAFNPSTGNLVIRSTTGDVTSTALNEIRLFVNGAISANAITIPNQTTGNIVIGRTRDSIIGKGVKLDINGSVNANNYYDSLGGVRSVPINAQTAAYICQTSDAGKLISITTGGITIPAGVFSTGDAFSIYNNSGTSQTITASAVNLYLAGTSSTGNRTLNQRGLATIICTDGANFNFVISGSGLA